MSDQGKERELVRKTVSFVLRHYERCGESGSATAFTLDPVNIDEWWSKMQLTPHNPEKLRPASRKHFLAREARWHELAERELLNV